MVLRLQSLWTLALDLSAEREEFQSFVVNVVRAVFHPLAVFKLAVASLYFLPQSLQSLVSSVVGLAAVDTHASVDLAPALQAFPVLASV